MDQEKYVCGEESTVTIGVGTWCHGCAKDSESDFYFNER
jgi:hypothetical protein